MVTINPRTPPPLRESDPLAEIVRDMGELFRQHSASLSAKIRGLEETITELRDRVQDLEGHAEHGSDVTCGVCAPDEPETVGADEYGTSDFDGECASLDCSDPIKPGDRIRLTDLGWSHHDCN